MKIQLGVALEMIENFFYCSAKGLRSSNYRSSKSILRVLKKPRQGTGTASVCFGYLSVTMEIMEIMENRKLSFEKNL